MRILVLMSLCVLAACAPMGSNVVALKAKNITPTHFSGALAAEYLAYAQSLAEQQHPMRADYFAGKGLSAAEGKNPQPEEAKEAQMQARKALSDLLTDDMKDIVPMRLARAQLLFDCWVDESKRVFDSEPALCAESFSEVLAELQAVAEVLVHGDDNRYSVTFAPASAQLSDQAQTMLNIIGKHVEGLGRYRVEIMGFAEGKKTTPKSKLLARNRALAIEKALIERGVNAGYIHMNKKTADKEVLLSVDKRKVNNDKVIIMLQTF